MKLVLILSVAFLVIRGTDALGWRIFAGREDCVSDALPDEQFRMLEDSLGKRGHAMPQDLNVVVEAGFLVANKYGAETSKGSVDVWVKNSAGTTVYHNEAVKEDNFSVHTKGTKGPWQLCFKISNVERINQHALSIELSYFTVNLRSLVGTDHEWSKDQATVDVGFGANVDNLIKADELQDLEGGLNKVSYDLSSFRRQISYINMRADRQLKTVKSTHYRTLWWSMLESTAIVCASLIQVLAVRHLFAAKNRRLVV